MDGKEPDMRLSSPPPKRSSRRRKSVKSGGSIWTLRHFLIVLGLSVLTSAASATYWFFSSGKATRLVSKTQHRLKTGVADLGFTVQNIVVDGRMRTKSKLLFGELGLKKGDFIYDVNLAKTLARLQALPWVHSARLERRLPGTVFVKLIEKHPVAFWQNKKKHYLVDSYGTLIGQFPLKDFPGYIIATGEGAVVKLPWLIQKLGAYEGVYAKTTGAIYVSGRRWNLVLNNELTIKLPEDDIDEALQRIAELDTENRLSSKGIDTIDLRNKGKVYFYLSPEGVARRKNGRGKAT